MYKNVKYNFLLKTATSFINTVFLTVFIICLHGFMLQAQENVVTVGFQFKPIIPLKYFYTEGADITQQGVRFQVQQKFGTSWGMSVRRGFTKIFSLESGISYVNRTYSLNIYDSVQVVNDRFHLIAYEIPLQGLIYIRLSDKLFMNTALGISLDLFPSDIYTEDGNYKHYSQRKGWVLPGISANLGYEYRTEKTGYFYLGLSYHRPFYNMYTTAIEYNNGNGTLETLNTYLAGNYLTIDFRYFFHEDPLKKKLKSTKKEKVN